MSDVRFREAPDENLIYEVPVNENHLPVQGLVVHDPVDPLRGSVQVENDGAMRPHHVVKRVHHGRIKKHIREASRMGYGERIPLLCAIADGHEIQMMKTIRTRRKFVADPTKIVEVEAGWALGDPDAWVWVQTTWKETAEIADRLKAIEMLGRMGGVNVPDEEDGELDDALANAEYAITFD